MRLIKWLLLVASLTVLQACEQEKDDSSDSGTGSGSGTNITETCTWDTSKWNECNWN